MVGEVAKHSRRVYFLMHDEGMHKPDNIRVLVRTAQGVVNPRLANKPGQGVTEHLQDDGLRQVDELVGHIRADAAKDQIRASDLDPHIYKQ